jgi:demethylmenaquinone methyltransferase/2-methoxy-6-polyprenyl-1,4-benzoquinol methylase
MFDGLVERYDLLNRLISAGQDGAWRRAAVRSLNPQPNDRILDLGCGTGDLLALLAGRARPVGLDVSARMLAHAHARLGSSARLLRGSAFELPFASGAFQGAVSGFVLRNLRDIEGAMAELARVLAPGAGIALLDATEPRGLLRPLFDLYFRLVAPALGAVAGRKGAYQYLASSLVQIPPPDEMCRLLAQAGFEDCRAQALTFGVVTLFTASRAR